MRKRARPARAAARWLSSVADYAARGSGTCAEVARCWRWTLEASGRQQEAVATPSLSESCTVQPQSSSTLARPQRSCLLGILLRLGMGRRAGTRGAAPSVRGRSCGRHLPSPGRKADPPPPNRLKTLDDAKNRGEELSRLLMSIEGRKYSPIFCVELPNDLKNRSQQSGDYGLVVIGRHSDVLASKKGLPTRTNAQCQSTTL